MISFKNFLTESRAAPLYHGTDSNKLISIIHENRIKPAVDYGETIPSISFTRSIKFATEWAKLTAWADPFVIELDQQKLTYNYKLVPFNFFNDKARRLRYKVGGMAGHNEYEERVSGKPIVNVDRYITKIISIRKPGKPTGGPADLILKHPLLYYNGKFVNK